MNLIIHLRTKEIFNYKQLKTNKMKKTKRKRIHKIYGTPLFNTSVEYRIKQVINQLMNVQPTLKTA